jgi:hypothetical protein
MKAVPALALAGEHVEELSEATRDGHPILRDCQAGVQFHLRAIWRGNDNDNWNCSIGRPRVDESAECKAEPGKFAVRALWRYLDAGQFTRNDLWKAHPTGA